MRTWLLLVALVAACRAADPDPDVPGAKFNKAELEAILKKEHSDRVSNIYDSENDIQCAAQPMPRWHLSSGRARLSCVRCWQVHMGRGEPGALPRRGRDVLKDGAIGRRRSLFCGVYAPVRLCAAL